MVWEPQNTLEYTIPLLKIWKYSCLPIYDYNLDHKSVALKKSFFVFVAIIFLVVNVSIYNFLYDFRQSLKDWLSLCQIIGTIIQNGIFVFSAYLNKDKIPVLLSKCLAVEKKINGLSQYESNFTKKGKHFIKILIMKGVISVIMLTVDFNYLVKNLNDYVFRYCLYSGFILYGVSEITILVLSDPLKKFYQDFIHIIKNETISKPKETVEIFLMLYELSQNTFSIIQWFILVKIVTDFFYTTTDLFYGTALTFESSTSIFSALLIFSIILLWFLSIAQSLINISFTFGKIAEQVLNTNYGFLNQILFLFFPACYFN